MFGVSYCVVRSGCGKHVMREVILQLNMLVDQDVFSDKLPQHNCLLLLWAYIFCTAFIQLVNDVETHAPENAYMRYIVKSCRR